MNRMCLAVILVFLPAAAQAQSADDLVQLWLAQHSIAARDYQTCDPSSAPVVGTDGICPGHWGVELGTQPTPTQLLALASTFRAQQTAQANAVAAMAAYATALNAGIAITSAGTSALNGTYGVDDTTELHINSELNCISVNGTFTNGQTTKLWLNAAGTGGATFTIAQFKTLVTAIGAYKDALIQARVTQATTGSATWPSAAATIP